MKTNLSNRPNRHTPSFEISFLIVLIFLALPGNLLKAQPTQESMLSELPLQRIALLSSGVGYFEHSGIINSSQPVEIVLPFVAEAVNDALKSLVINDPASRVPSVRYAAENTLYTTLRSLQIDLSGNPGIGYILASMRGADLEVSAPGPIRGRIMGVERRQVSGASPFYPAEEEWLSLYTSQGIRSIAVKDIAAFRFIDENINADLERALDLITSSRNTQARNLHVTLDGLGSRAVSLSYVIPAPVWKVSYRLDLSGSEPFLQGWAIVDNDSDTDWNGVELSLLTGRPVSFIQNLYPPYRVSRPVVPLSIAGIAESRTHESGYGAPAYNQAYDDRMLMAEQESKVMTDMMMPQASAAARSAPAPASTTVSGGTMQTAAGSAAGDQFEFTLRYPVFLERRRSAMLPLVEGSVRAEKFLVFSGAHASGGMSINPEISVELTNTSGMKLPAGPITVYDGGTYAGDALIEFFPEDEKRLISYGEDLSVSGTTSQSSSRYVTAVNVSGGVMTISRRQSIERIYTIRNASRESKNLIIEHPITSGYDLAQPASADDRTSALYRFKRSLAAGQTLSFTVREEMPLSERITLTTMRPETFLSYSTNQEIPPNVRAALAVAVEMRRTADSAEEAQRELAAQLSRLTAEQDRIRRNLEAAGNQTPQGQEYLRRLSDLDNEIDAVNRRIDEAVREVQRTRRAYDDYVAGLNL